MSAKLVPTSGRTRLSRRADTAGRSSTSTTRPGARLQGLDPGGSLPGGDLLRVHEFAQVSLGEVSQVRGADPIPIVHQAILPRPVPDR